VRPHARRELGPCRPTRPQRTCAAPAAPAGRGPRPVRSGGTSPGRGTRLAAPCRRRGECAVATAARWGDCTPPGGRGVERTNNLPSPTVLGGRGVVGEGA